MRSGLLSAVPAYYLHHPARRRYPRRRVWVPEAYDQFNCDLVDLQRWKCYNLRFRYLLTCVDSFSKMAWVEPLRTKSSKVVAKAFERILRRCDRLPKHVASDQGKEFIGKEFQQLLRSNGIKYFHTNSNLKNTQVERFNRSLMQRISRWMTSSKSKNYRPVLQDIVDGYNLSFHRAVGMTPVEAAEEKNKTKAFLNLYGPRKALELQGRIWKPKQLLNVGDTVLVASRKDPFRKSYEQSFKPERFKVIHVRKSQPPMYYLRNSQGRDIKGGFYHHEVLKLPH